METIQQLDERKLVKQWYLNKDVKKLVAYFFNRDIPQHLWLLPTKSQESIIKTILYGKNERMLISAHTRYGKSQWVGVAVALRILFSKNRKIFLIAPTNDKTKILRDYVVSAIINCTLLRTLLDTSASGTEALKKEVSKSRMTFSNGCIIQTVSAEGDGMRIMGLGLGSDGGDLIVDELAEINKDVVYTKILRMLGDSPEKSNFIGLFNPWEKDSAAYEMWISGSYKVLHIDWRIGVEEGRISEAFLDSQRKTLTKNHFMVLYDSVFPEESDDALIPYSDIMTAKDDYELGDRNKEVMIGCDVAAEGIDKTVLTVVEHDLEHDIYRVKAVQDFSKQDTMKTAGRIANMINKYQPVRVNIDTIGLGRGVVDRLLEQGFDVLGVNVGRKATENDKLYLNQKSQMYDSLRRLFEQQRIKNVFREELRHELNVMKWETGSNGKMKIIDPQKSPDFADSLALAVFDSSPGFLPVDDNFFI